MVWWGCENTCNFLFSFLLSEYWTKLSPSEEEDFFWSKRQILAGICICAFSGLSHNYKAYLHRSIFSLEQLIFLNKVLEREKIRTPGGIFDCVAFIIIIIIKNHIFWKKTWELRRHKKFILRQAKFCFLKKKYSTIFMTQKVRKDDNKKKGKVR